jgi:hypothetical protein
MRVLVLSQHFTPEVTAARFRIEPFVEALRSSGHDVEVVCAVPNHPEGVIHPPFRGRALVRKRAPGLEVAYVWVRVTPEKTMRTRLEFYGSYAAMATAVGAVARRPDVVLASSPPLTVGLAGASVAARQRVPGVLAVRDLWPKAAVVLGEVWLVRSIELSDVSV